MAHDALPDFETTDFNEILAFAGGWLCLFGLFSHLLKERLSLSEPLISFTAGIAFGPHGFNLVSPASYTTGSGPDDDAAAALHRATFNFSRLVLGVQLVLVGAQLPRRYLRAELRPLLVLLGPVLTAAWLLTSLLVWALVPPLSSSSSSEGGGHGGGLSLLEALAVGACVAPTDPVLSAVVVKGAFAERHVPEALRRLIVAESGANDGLGYPFLFFALYLIKYAGGTTATTTTTAHALTVWALKTWLYVVLLGAALGFAAGRAAARCRRAARAWGWADRGEGRAVFPVALGLLVTGACGAIGTDDVLACFAAGSALAWGGGGDGEDEDEDEDENENDDEDAVQAAVDMLLNVGVFVWLGAVCPWELFAGGHGGGGTAPEEAPPVPLARLAALGALVLLLRRLPAVLLARRWLPQARGRLRDALFTGFFGPIGVSAVFYLYVGLRFLAELRRADPARAGEVDRLYAVLRAVVWFLIVCSVVVHGLSIPLGRLVCGLLARLGAARSGACCGRDADEAGLGEADGAPGSPVLRRPRRPSEERLLRDAGPGYMSLGQ